MDATCYYYTSNGGKKHELRILLIRNRYNMILLYKPMLTSHYKKQLFTKSNHLGISNLHSKNKCVIYQVLIMVKD